MNTTTNTRNRKWLASVLSAAVAAGLLGACGNRASDEDIARAAMSINQAASGAPGEPQGLTGGDSGGSVADAATPVGGGASGATAGSATGSAAQATGTGGTKKAPSGSPVASAPSGRQAAEASAASGGTATDAPGATAAAAAPGANRAAGCVAPKAPVIIGTVGNQSGIVGAAVFPGVKAVQAWAAAQNDRGGIDCHPINMSWPTTAATRPGTSRSSSSS